MNNKFYAVGTVHHLIISASYEEMIKHMIQRYDGGYTCFRNCGLQGKVHFRIEGLSQILVDRFNKFIH